VYIWGAAGNGPRSLYRSDDAGQSFVRINDDAHEYGGPGNGEFVIGDANVYGRVYMSSAGRGLILGELARPDASP
jgi:xyloglucan-specific exo-beta-1,4-glucanase